MTQSVKCLPYEPKDPSSALSTQVIQCNAMQYNTIQHDPVQHNTTQYSTTQHNITQYNTIQYNTTQYNTIQHNTTQYNTTQHNTIQESQAGHTVYLYLQLWGTEAGGIHGASWPASLAELANSGFAGDAVSKNNTQSNWERRFHFSPPHEGTLPYRCTYTNLCLHTHMIRTIERAC